MHGRGVAPAALALLLFSGSLKASPWLAWSGVYLQAGLLVFVLAVAARVLIVERPQVVVTPVALVGLVALLGALHAPLLDYGHTKTVNMLVTVAVAGAAVVVVTDESRRVRFLQGVVAVAVLAAVLAVFAPSTEVAAGRLAAAGATTSATGRIAGAGLVVLVAWAMAGWLRRRWLGLAAVAAFAVVMFATGSRGPLMAAVLAGLVVLLAGFARHPARALGILASAAVVGWWAWTQASPVAKERIGSVLSADRGASVGQREFMWQRSWDIATSTPVTSWRGWGNLTYSDLIVDKYPHNLLLEVVVEAGWLALVAVMILLAVGAVRAARGRVQDAAALPLLGLLVFTLVSAMVSGDVTDNRIVFVVAAACWTLRPRSEPFDDLDVPRSAGATSTRGVAVERRASTAAASAVAARAASSAGARRV